MGRNIRSKRAAANVSGQALCDVAGISRTRLSEIERGYITPGPEELQRLTEGIDQIERNRAALAQLAAAQNISLVGTGVRL